MDKILRAQLAYAHPCSGSVANPNPEQGKRDGEQRAKDLTRLYRKCLLKSEVHLLASDMVFVLFVLS